MMYVRAKSPKTGDTYTLVILGDEVLMRGPCLTGGCALGITGASVWSARGGKSMPEFLIAAGADYVTTRLLHAKERKAEVAHFRDHVWPEFCKALRRPVSLVPVKPLEDLAGRWCNRAAPLAEVARRAGDAPDVATTLVAAADELTAALEGT